MADTDVLDTSQILKDAVAANKSVSASTHSGGNPDALTGIVNSVAAALNLHAATTKAVQTADSELSTQLNQVVTSGAAQMTAAGEAASRLTTNEVEAKRQTQIENKALDTGVDAQIATSLRDFNANMDTAANEIKLAHQREQTTLGAVLRGNASFGEWYNATFSDPASAHREAAATASQLANLEASRIQHIQSTVSGEIARNTATVNTLGEGAVADSAKVEAIKYANLATNLQLEGIKNSVGYVRQVQSQLNHGDSVALAKGNLEISAENSKRQYESLQVKELDFDTQAKYVQMYMKFMNRPDAEAWTAERIKAFSNTPANKQQLSIWLNAGGMLLGQASIDPNAPPPNVFGTPGEAITLVNQSHGTLPQNMQILQRKLQELSANTTVDPITGKALKPIESIELTNNKVGAWINDAVKPNMDADPVYGQPNIKVITTMASMNTPEVQEFNKKVIFPLAASGEIVSADVIAEAASTSGLSQNQVIAGLTAYGHSATMLVSTRGHQVVGLPTAPSLGYTASVHTGSMFGGRKTVDLTDEKQVRDWVFRKGLYNKAKTNSLTLIDAAAANVIAGHEEVK